MPYRAYRHGDPRRYVLHARLVATGHPEAPAMLCLGIIAAGWLLMGVGVITHVAADDPTLVHTLVPDSVRIAWWVIPALLALHTLGTGQGSTATVAALTIGPTVRVASYLWSWITDLIPGAPHGYPGAWYSATYHVLLLALVVLASMLTRGDTLRDALTDDQEAA